MVYQVLGFLVGFIFLMAGVAARWLGRPDKNLAAIHRQDADALIAKGDTGMAAMALIYAEETERGEHLIPKFLHRALLAVGAILMLFSILW